MNFPTKKNLGTLDATHHFGQSIRRFLGSHVGYVFIKLGEWEYEAVRHPIAYFCNCICLVEHWNDFWNTLAKEYDFQTTFVKWLKKEQYAVPKTWHPLCKQCTKYSIYTNIFALKNFACWKSHDLPCDLPVITEVWNLRIHHLILCFTLTICASRTRPMSIPVSESCDSSESLAYCELSRPFGLSDTWSWRTLGGGFYVDSKSCQEWFQGHPIRVWE